MGQADFEMIRKAIRELNERFGGKMNIEEWQNIDNEDCLKIVLTWKRSAVLRVFAV